MTVEKITDNEKITLAISGMLDTANAPAFEEAVDAATNETKDLTLNFENVEYISSSGLRVLLKAQKKMNANNGKMVLVKVADSVIEVFELTGFKDILTIQ